jgi:hypothetical protein
MHDNLFGFVCHLHINTLSRIKGLMIMERKYVWKMKEAEKVSFGEKVSLPPL